MSDEITDKEQTCSKSGEWILFEQQILSGTLKYCGVG
jgi:hypothetical protein